jgi:hypothetical protein
MLHAISWNQFLAIVALSLLAYYIIILLVYYRQDLLARIQTKPDLIPAGTTNHAATEYTQSSSHLMGPTQVLPLSDATAIQTQSASSTAPQYSVLAAEEITVAAPPPATAEVLLLGTVADLLEEIKALVAIIAEHQGEKAESLPLFGALFARYPQLEGTPYQDAITLYLFDACKGTPTLEVSVAELRDLWQPEK